MYRFFMVFVLYLSLTAATFRGPSALQLLIFKEKNEGQCKILTTSGGSPVEYNEASNTLNSDLIFNEFFMESITHTVRERTPDRVVHAKGAGAFGYFEVTHNITNICKAKLFDKVGKKTPVAVRFSPIASEKGKTDFTRESRGFAVKFYTEDGNFDLLGLSAPMFSFRDPIVFPSFVHALRRNPVSNLYDADMFWDFLTLNPETLHMALFIFGDHGIPKGFRHLPGYGIHTFQLVNEYGENNFVRFHIIPDAGIQSLYSDEAKNMSLIDPDYATKDLYEALAEGNYPSWTISVQVLSLDDVKNADFDVFDVTKVLPLDDYPLQPIGKLVLNRNPTNYFAEIEQLAYTPGHLVPGILGAPDKLFEARRLAYRESLNYRLGVNFDKIPVNCPLRNQAYSYNQDGKPPVNDNDGDAPNYHPNSFNGPKTYADERRGKLIKINENKPDNFDQVRELYINNMTEEERSRVVKNIVNILKRAVEFLQRRAIKLFTLIHPDLGNRVKQELKLIAAKKEKKNKH